MIYNKNIAQAIQNSKTLVIENGWLEKRRQMIIKKSLMGLVAVVLILGFAIACAPVATPVPEVQPTAAPVVPATEAPTAVPTATPIVITDTIGHTVTFDTLPQRIVIAGKATSLLLNTLYMFPEAKERLAAYELRQQTAANFAVVVDPGLSTKMKLETNAGPEQIAPAKPDVVILKSSMEEKLGKPLEAIGIKVVYVDMETPEKFYADIRNLGTILGDPTRAEEIVAFYQSKTTAISDKVAGMKEGDKPSVLLLQYSSKDNTIAFNVPPVEWLQTLMVSSTGGTPVWTDAADSGGWTVVTLEQIAVWNPEIIFIVDYSGNAVDVAAKLRTDSQWKELKAVKNGQLFAFPTDFLSWDQPDSRWILGMTWAAAKIHPDLFPDIKITDEITSFYKSLYKMDDKVITDQILPLYRGD